MDEVECIRAEVWDDVNGTREGYGTDGRPYKSQQHHVDGTASTK